MHMNMLIWVFTVYIWHKTGLKSQSRFLPECELLALEAICNAETIMLAFAKSNCENEQNKCHAQ